MKPEQPSSLASAVPTLAKPPIVALVAVSALSPFSINAVVPSMPAIEVAFGASYGRVQLILSAFLASVALAQILIGPLSDRFGRRPIMLGGFVLFILACLVAPFAPTVDALIAIRVVQGATGCVGIVLGRAIVRDLYDRRQAASMLGYVTMGLAMAPMVAPLIGGLLQEAFGWRTIFWFMGLLGVGCLAVTWAYVPETNLRPTNRLSFGTILRDYRKLLANRDFVLFAASCGLTSGVFFAFLGGAPYISERLLGLTPAVYGLWFGALPIGYACGNFLAGRFTERFGVARMILAGSSLALIAVALPPLLFQAGLVGPAEIFLPMTLGGMANGIALPSAIAGAISARPEIAGAASGLAGAAQIGTGAVLSAVAGALLAGGASAMPMFLLMCAAALFAFLISLEIFRRNRR
jgi:DHA1 family bicyclomycin/chloramphenicol resistance-like MFS transporter